MMNESIVITNEQGWEKSRLRQEEQYRIRLLAEDPANREFYNQLYSIFPNTLGEYFIENNYEFYHILIESYLDVENEEYTPPSLDEIMYGVFETYQNRFVEFEYLQRMENENATEFHAMDNDERIESLSEEFDYDYSYSSQVTEDSAIEILCRLKLCFVDEDERVDGHENTYLVNDPQRYLFIF